VFRGGLPGLRSAVTASAEYCSVDHISPNLMDILNLSHWLQGDQHSLVPIIYINPINTRESVPFQCTNMKLIICNTVSSNCEYINNFQVEYCADCIVEQHRRYKHKVTLRRVRVTMVAVEKQYVLHIPSVRVCLFIQLAKRMHRIILSSMARPAVP
jgi:hypothetical protein